MVFRRKKKEPTPEEQAAGETKPTEAQTEASQPQAAPEPQPSPAPSAGAAPEADSAAGGFSLPEANTTPRQAAGQTPPPQTPPDESAAQKPSRSAGFFRKLWRAVLIALVLFGLGFVTAAWFLYRPEHQKAAQVATLKSQLAEAQQQVATLKKQVSDLKSTIQSQKDTVAKAKMRIALAEALRSAYATRLALADQDTTGASIQMAALEKALHTLQETVPDAQKSAIGDLLKQADDINSKLDSPAYADRQLKALIEHLQAITTLLSNP